MTESGPPLKLDWLFATDLMVTLRFRVCMPSVSLVRLVPPDTAPVCTKIYRTEPVIP